MNKYFLSVLLGCWGMGGLADDEALTLDELMPMFGWDFEATEIRSEKVGDGPSCCSVSAGTLPFPLARTAS